MVVRLQIMLDRAGFSPGQIDGNVGQNTLTALAGYQRAYGFEPITNEVADKPAEANPTQTNQGSVPSKPPKRTLDPATWNALNDTSAAALTPYRITSEDIKGPFIERPPNLAEQADLDYLGYASPEESLAEKFHLSPTLLRQLNPGAAFTQDAEIWVPNIRSVILGSAAKVVVSKSDRTVTALNAEGDILAQYPASSGSDYDPLPIGEWEVTAVAREPVFHYNPDLFWDADADDEKATIAPGPRNPVGLVWIDLTKEHYGIHGTPSPEKIGFTESHGCIRLTNWDAMELADLVAPGTPVIMVE